MTEPTPQPDEPQEPNVDADADASQDRGDDALAETVENLHGPRTDTSVLADQIGDRGDRRDDPHRRLKRLIVSGIVTLVITTTLGVLVLFYYADEINRYRAMARLCSDDKDEQARGVGYLINHASDPRVVAHAERMLDDADGACFDRIVWALGEAGVWGPNFERAWVRYLTRRIDTVTIPKQRSYIAVELARLLWRRGPHHDDPAIPDAIARLLKDEDANARLNALSAAACLPDHDRRVELLRLAAADQEPEVARHAWIMLGLLREARSMPTPEDAPPAVAQAVLFAKQGGKFVDRPTGPAEDAAENVKRFAELEATATASLEGVELAKDLPPLVRLHAVRVTKDSTIDDLLPAFRAEAHTTRDVGCVIALERFSPTECRELAAKLASSFNDQQRMAGAILAGLTGRPDGLASLKEVDPPASRPSLESTPNAALVVPDPTADDLPWWVHVRLERGDDWILKQHYQLTAWMWAFDVSENGAFDPAPLLLKSKMPRTSTTLAMLHMGRLDGMDWLINPLGGPGVGDEQALRILLDQLRYDVVLRRYFPEMPEFWLWGDTATQDFQIDVIRDWYLMFRPQLRFDETRRVFLVKGSS